MLVFLTILFKTLIVFISLTILLIRLNEINRGGFQGHIQNETYYFPLIQTIYIDNIDLLA
jgi:hypothetical protein